MKKIANATPAASLTLGVASSNFAVWLGVWVIAAVVLVVHARSFLPFISDDALISLRYAQRLLEGHGLTWSDGPRVEGYTNLLWVLACTLLGLFKIDLIDSSRVWGFVGMSFALGAVVYAYRPARWKDSLGSLSATVGLALTAPIAFWTIGGMEQPFVAAFLAWAVALSLPLVDGSERNWRRAMLPGFFLGLVCLTRADGGVLCVALALALLAARGISAGSFKHIIGLGIWPVVLGGGQLAFRLLYYGEWLPNPARVKVAFTSERIAEGLQYVRAAAPYLAGFLVVALAGVIVGLSTTRLRRRTIFFFVAWLVWTGYVILIGGDIFPAHRHLVASIVLAAFLVAQVGEYLTAQSSHARAAGWVGAGMMCIVLAATQRIDPEVQRGIEETWEWDGKVVGEFMRQAFGATDPLIACDPAGCIPYFSRLRCIDMMGLNDYHIARHRTSEFGRGMIGHELGDGQYVLDRQPDIVLWTLPTGFDKPLFRSAREMDALPEFHRQYRFVFIRTAEPLPLMVGLWVRFDSPKVGVQFLPDRIVAPGLLFAIDDKTAAVLDAEGRLGAMSTSEHPATLPGFAPPPGRWRIVVEASVPVKITLRPVGSAQTIADGVGEVLLNRKPTHPFMDIELRPAGDRFAHVRRLVFMSLPSGS